MTWLLPCIPGSAPAGALLCPQRPRLHAAASPMPPAVLVSRHSTGQQGERKSRRVSRGQQHCCTPLGPRQAPHLLRMSRSPRLPRLLSGRRPSVTSQVVPCHQASGSSCCCQGMGQSLRPLVPAHAHHQLARRQALLPAGLAQEAAAGTCQLRLQSLSLEAVVSQLQAVHRSARRLPGMSLALRGRGGFTQDNGTPRSGS